jgi:hypothetical protein
MQCVVDTGNPKCEAVKITPAVAVSAANPCTGLRSIIFVPSVLIIRTPPAAVPSPIAAALAKITQVGTTNFDPVMVTDPYATSAIVITPIVF